MSEREQQLAWIIRRMARVNPLTPEAINRARDVDHLRKWNSKRLVKAITKAAKDYRARDQLGRLRAAALLGVTLLGDEFLQAAERSGVFLSKLSHQEKFGRFLNSLADETSRTSEPGWKQLNVRLASYRTHLHLLRELSPKPEIVSLLRTRPRLALRTVLTIAALSFLREYFSFRLPDGVSELIDDFGEPEEIASAVSLLVALANDYRPVDAVDFAYPLGDPDFGQIRQLLAYGKGLALEYEIGKLLSLFRYSLEAIGGKHAVLLLRPPYPEFEYFVRLGYIRSQMGRTRSLVDLAASEQASALSMRTAAETFAKKFREVLVEIKDPETDWRRLRLNFPALPKLYETVKQRGFYEDILYQEQLQQDFLIPLRRLNEPELRLTDNLKLDTFHGAWRYLQFASLVDISLLRPFSSSDPTLFLNSIVRVANEKATIELIKLLGLSDTEAEDFFDLVSSRSTHLGYLDLQYRPFFRLAQSTKPDGTLSEPEVIHLAPLVCTSNVLRNVQSANKLRLESNASIFVEVAAKILRSRFPRVVTNKRVKGKASTDIDIVLFEKNVLYLLECKHSLPPTGPHEMRDIWEEIEYGTKQLSTAIEILADQARRHSYLTGWFPGTKPHESGRLKIITGVLCSHRIFAGLEHRGIPVRDLGSLLLLCESGVMVMEAMTSEDAAIKVRYRITAEPSVSGPDLEDYFSRDSKFFRSYAPFMCPLARTQLVGTSTLARETYVYNISLAGWIDQMERIGFKREPDVRRTITWNSSVGPEENL